jgi:tetratricopeptide (TPR) repeat protein
LFLFLTVSLSPVKAQEQSKLDSLNVLLETAPNDSVRIYQLVNISREYYTNNIPMSLEFAQKALTLAEKGKDENLVAYSLFNLGRSYFNQGFLEISTKYFYRYLDIQKAINNSRGTAYALVNLGAIHLQLKQFEKSREFFEHGLETLNQLAKDDDVDKPGTDIITIYNNLGIVSQNLGETDKAIDYYTRGISQARKTPEEHVILANLLNNLGTLYLEEGKLAEAFGYLTEALNIRIQNDNKSGQVNSYRSMSMYFNKQKDKAEELKYLNMGIKLADEIGSISQLANLTEKIFGYYQELQNADSALKYNILFTEYMKKLNEEATRKELAHLELASQLKEKEKIQQFEQKRKELLYLVAGLILTLTVAILSLLYFISHSRNRRLTLEKEIINLNSKNLELEKESIEKELDLKNKEMATNVMYQIQKNEMIHDIVEKLQKHSTTGLKQDDSWILEIIRDLEKTQEKSVWNEFEVRFQQVHNDFYKKLNDINPELSTNERRLCAFLKLNMTTKEISTITGQVPRSIDVARTRLRKKLNLTNSEVSLIEFLSTI